MIELLRAGKVPTERAIKQLCLRVMEIMMEEPTMRRVHAPVSICGDLHGKFYDVLELFRQGGEVPTTSYVFLGDIVDRGHYNLETILLLLCLKAKYPDNVTLLRGNHETRGISTRYGFYEECVNKCGSANAWKYCTDVFDYFNVAALVEDKILCLHGGLSPDVGTLDQITEIDRVREVPPAGAFADLLWSDPEDVDTWAINPRGVGYYFGAKVATEFCHHNAINLIARSHQLVLEGYKYHFADKSVVTVWSCPNYCYRSGNKAAIMQVNTELQQEFCVFEEVPEPGASDGNQSAAMVQYFM